MSYFLSCSLGVYYAFDAIVWGRTCWMGFDLWDEVPPGFSV